MSFVGQLAEGISMQIKKLLMILATVFVGSMAQAASDSVRIWKLAESPRAVAIVVHGLNTLPAKMSSLEKVLQDDHVDVLRVTFSGHNGNREVFKLVSRTRWISDFARGYQVAKARAAQLGVPLYFIGFSLGGLIAMDFLNDPAQQAHFDKIVLIAPALAVNGISRWIKGLNLFGNVMVPSANVMEYRANLEGTPLAAYNALFESLAVVEQADFRRAHVPTLVFLDKRDEMVSASGIEELIQKRDLREWKTSYIYNNKSLLKSSFHHLMIDEPSMGRENWKLMKDQILEHFR
jgi:esterase/lipase